MHNKQYIWALTLVCLAIFFSNLDVIYVNIMEARNFITAREMLQNGNWLHTTMNLEPRYEKPPLPTWLTAFSAAIFGLDSLFGMRLPAVLSVSFLIFTCYFLALKIFKNKQQALTSALILATSFYIVFSGRNGQWDIFAHAFMLFAIYKLFQVFQGENNNWKNWLLIGLFLGLSFMSKGPVSIFALFLPFLIAYGIVYKYKKATLNWTKIITSIIVFAVVGLSWGAYIFLTDGASAEAISDKETAAWANRNVRPFYYYWSFFTQSGIWTFFAFIGLLYPFLKKRVDNLKAYQFTILWTFITVILLSLIPEKKSRYLLPVLIPLAFNNSFYLQYLFTKGKELTNADKYIANFGFGLIAIIGFAFPIIGYILFGEQLLDYKFSYINTSIGLVLFSIGIVKTLYQQNYQKAFYGIIGFMCVIMVFGFPLAKILYDNDDFNNIKNLRSETNLEQIPLYHMGELAPELIWELGEPAKKIESIEQLPTNKTVGLFVRDSLSIDSYKNLKAELKQQYDINYIHKSKSGYKDRLTTKFYLIEKN